MPQTAVLRSLPITVVQSSTAPRLRAWRRAPHFSGSYWDLHWARKGLRRALGAAAVDIDEEGLAVRAEARTSEFDRVAQVARDVEDLAGRRDGADALRRGRVLAEHDTAPGADVAIVRTVEHVVIWILLDDQRDGPSDEVVNRVLTRSPCCRRLSGRNNTSVCHTSNPRAAGSARRRPQVPR